MIVCDICGRKTDSSGLKELYARTRGDTGGFAKVEVHLCGYCRADLERKKRDVEADFYNGRINK